MPDLWNLISPYGIRRLVFVLLVLCCQGVFQVIGVASVFPFLAIASDPELIRQSTLGLKILGELPPMSDQALLVTAGVVSIFCLFCAQAIQIVGEIIRVGYAQGLGHWLRLKIIRNIISNKYSYFLTRNSGELLKKAYIDASQVANLVLIPLLQAICCLVTIIMLLVALIFVNPIIAISSGLIFGFLYTLIYQIFKKPRNSNSSQMKHINRESMKELQQVFGGVKAIKIHGKESHFISRYAKYSEEQARLHKWHPILNNTPKYTIELIAFGSMIVVVTAFIAAGKPIANILPTLGVMAFAGYRILPNLQALYASLTTISINRHTVEEVFEECITLHSESKALPTEDPAVSEVMRWNNEIQIEDVCFSYPENSQNILDHLDLTICKNEFVAFIGETGSGKSTLIDLILALHEPQNGAVKIDGIPLNSDTVRSWRNSIGYVPQEIFLIDDTIAANIAFGSKPKEIDRERLREVSHMAQISDYIETNLHLGYETIVGERGVRLSGGQKQRIGLARALYHNPSTLILDEATSALDDKTETALMKALEIIHGELTIIVIAHRISTIRKADRVFRLENGNISAVVA